MNNEIKELNRHIDTLHLRMSELQSFVMKLEKRVHKIEQSDIPDQFKSGEGMRVD